MAVRDKVRDAQRALATLDVAHSRAVARFDEMVVQRTEILTEAERQVAAARTGVEAAIAEMARQVGVDLAATVLGVEVSEVRRLVKACPQATVQAPTNGRTVC